MSQRGGVRPAAALVCAGSSRRTAAFAAMARASLGLFALAMSSSACLVTSVPEFQPPEEAGPFLLSATADPDPRKIVLLDEQNITPSFFVSFAADVVSQDDPKNPERRVKVRLYIDYGLEDQGTPEQPFRFVILANPLDPGTIDQTTGRRAAVKWFPAAHQVGFGCHTATLVASREFDETTGCPKSADDYSMITWQVFHCDESDPAVGCEMMDVSPCQKLTRSCFSQAIDAGAP
jgi:hypothetical protein